MTEALDGAVTKFRSVTSLSAPRSTSGLGLMNNLPYEDDEETAHTDHCGSRFVMSEKNPLRLVWSGIVFLLLGYTATIFLYRFAFCHFRITEDGPSPVEDTRGWEVFDKTVDYLFIGDLFANFFLSYKDHRGKEVDSMRLIAKKYLLGYFWVNLIACLPEEVVKALISAIADGVENLELDTQFNKIARVTRLQRVSRLARLVRLTRLAKLVSFVSSNHYWKQFQSLRGVRVVNFIFGLLWTLHLLACFWYLAAALQGDPEETWVGRRVINKTGATLLSAPAEEQWLVSMYFVLTVFTTVGFGDISAVTEVEIIFVAFTMLIGAVVHSIIISEVIGIVTSTDQVQEFVEKQIKLITAFAEHTEISMPLQKRLTEEVTWRSKSVAVHRRYNKEEMEEFITGRYMPRSILEEMPASIFNGKLATNRFVRSCQGTGYVPPRFSLLLAVHLVKVEYDTNEIVYEMHDFPFNIHIVTSGTFACVARPTKDGGIDDRYLDEEGGQAIQDDCAAGGMPFTPGQAMAGAMTPARVVKAVEDMVCTPHSPSGNPPPMVMFPYRLFSHGNYFGDFEIISGRPRHATVRCERAGTTLVLPKQDLFGMQDNFPQFRKTFENAARSRERYRNMAVGRLTQGSPLRTFAAKRIQSYVRERQAKQAEAERHSSNGEAEGQTDGKDGTEFHRIIRSSTCSMGPLVPPSPPSVLEKVEELGNNVASLRADFDTFRSELRTELHELLKGVRSV